MDDLNRLERRVDDLTESLAEVLGELQELRAAVGEFRDLAKQFGWIPVRRSGW